MYTVLELINLSSDFLNKKGIDSPRLNAELLLAGVLGCKRLELYLSFDKPLEEKEIELYREYIKRRGKFEPLQYILGEVEFYGIKFIINNSVLIPRQETEILVERVIECADKEKNLAILDIGTGSGNIVVTLAKYLTNSVFTAVDISAEAIAAAQNNAAYHNVEQKITFLQEDILADNFSNQGIFDVIVSNPPYIALKEYRTLQNEILNFEPKIALTDFEDGYKFYSAITQKSLRLLRPGGLLFFEAGEGQGGKIAEILKQNGFIKIQMFKDYLDIDRVITGVKS